MTYPILVRILRHLVYRLLPIDLDLVLLRLLPIDLISNGVVLFCNHKQTYQVLLHFLHTDLNLNNRIIFRLSFPQQTYLVLLHLLPIALN